MSILKSIFNYFSQPKLSLSQDSIFGMIDGCAVGEALGLPVVGADAIDLIKHPITEMLGFSDGITPGGSVSVCTNSVFDISQFLIDNEIQGYAPQRILSLINAWYLYRVQGEENKMHILLPASVVVGSVFAVMPVLTINEALRCLPDLVCDSVIATSSIFFGVSLYLARGYKPRKAIQKAKTLSKLICSKIGLVVSSSGTFAELIKLLDALADCVEDGYPAVVLATINNGFMPDLSGALIGSLSGFISKAENIPQRWKSLLLCSEAINSTSEALFKYINRVGEENKVY